RLRQEEVERNTSQTGTPRLDANRSEIVARVKSEPVLYWEPPRIREGELPLPLAQLREAFFDGARPGRALEAIYRRLRRSPSDMRKVLLTEGYVYAESPGLAVLLGRVALDHLFEDAEVFVLRGARLLRAKREKNVYVWQDGPERGTPARLWLFDRVGSSVDQLLPAKHVAVPASAVLPARAFAVERLTERGVLAQATIGDRTARVLFSVQDGGLRFDCARGLDRTTLDVERARMLRERRVLAAMEAGIAEQLAEGLPFDEPKTEDGQQDGKLRPEWRKAYREGLDSFEFNGDTYDVFDSSGRPRVPQVCADFVVDTWERMAGTRWLPRQQGRGRRVGRLDFDALPIENRRSVEQLIEFARMHPEWFELLEIPEHRRVAFSERKRFFRRLYEQRDAFRPGDVVAVLGPRDDERLHYHSFFIVAADPITGMPTRVAANAGRPRIRSWEAELENAPKRGIVARIRPHLEWLEALLQPETASTQGT
ncbi:MAG TPA: hypothetical protein VFQ61_32540, partial [Polyangiaceae bacterium]|nr:hypothetical protein [Polyangiaceae bacterium]